ncbi:unnamed protein product [Candida verbasci]|uniref:Mating factor alpha n=1 Tax=Candida verbasci TaxID=1227364 RepID=A0A9W4TSS0_9ASCO|nr:unnamed protein product [Candida verbasci]
MKFSTTILSIIAAVIVAAAPVEDTAPVESDFPFPEEAIKAIIPVSDESAPTYAEYNGVPYLILVNTTALGDSKVKSKRGWTRYRWFEPHK